MPPSMDMNVLMGPLSGLAISLFFCFQLLRKFDATIERLVNSFEAELIACNKRYDYVLSELMKLKER